MAEWRQRRSELVTDGQKKKAGGKPSADFMAEYAKFAEKYPDTSYVTAVPYSTADSHEDESASASAPEWLQLYDESSEAYYYQHQTTGETSWDEPASFVPYSEY